MSREVWDASRYHGGFTSRQKIGWRSLQFVLFNEEVLLRIDPEMAQSMNLFIVQNRTDRGVAKAA